MFFFMPNYGGLLCRVSRMSKGMLEEKLRNSKQIRTFEARVNNAIVHLFKIVPVSQMHINQLKCEPRKPAGIAFLFKAFATKLSICK